MEEGAPCRAAGAAGGQQHSRQVERRRWGPAELHRGCEVIALAQGSTILPSAIRNQCLCVLANRLPVGGNASAGRASWARWPTRLLARRCGPARDGTAPRRRTRAAVRCRSRRPTAPTLAGGPPPPRTRRPPLPGPPRWPVPVDRPLGQAAAVWRRVRNRRRPPRRRAAPRRDQVRSLLGARGLGHQPVATSFVLAQRQCVGHGYCLLVLDSRGKACVAALNSDWVPAFSGRSASGGRESALRGAATGTIGRCRGEVRRLAPRRAPAPSVGDSARGERQTACHE